MVSADHILLEYIIQIVTPIYQDTNCINRPKIQNRKCKIGLSSINWAFRIIRAHAVNMKQFHHFYLNKIDISLIMSERTVYK